MTLILVREPDADVCPLCRSSLGRPRGATRRQPVLTPTTGVFRWRCPDCRGVWQVETPARQGAGRGMTMDRRRAAAV